MHIVVTGNPVDGLTFHGTFAEGLHAVEWADVELDGEEWWLTSLEQPTNTNPDHNWARDDIQFPRLLSEMAGCMSFNENDLTLLCESMDLSRAEVNELFERAQAAWDRIRAINT